MNYKRLIRKVVDFDIESLYAKAMSYVTGFDNSVQVEPLGLVQTYVPENKPSVDNIFVQEEVKRTQVKKTHVKYNGGRVLCQRTDEELTIDDLKNLFNRVSPLEKSLE